MRCFFGFHDYKMIGLSGGFTVGVYRCQRCGAGMQEPDYDIFIFRWLLRRKLNPEQMKKYLTEHHAKHGAN